MSIQDESFPYDEDLEFSTESGKNWVFPHHKPRRSNVLPNKDTNETEHGPSANEGDRLPSSSPAQIEVDSTQSSNDFCLSSETSGKTNASEPNYVQAPENKKLEVVRNNPNKSISYQDIHSEYTKKRYRHVESKVGQYIANIKAQDEKRRNSSKFQRHRSMPETLHGRETTATELNNDSKKFGLLRHSANDIDGIHNHHNDVRFEHDTDNYDNITTTTSSVSTKDLVKEKSLILEKLMSVKERNEYLETKLEEKNAENWRLKQNLDTIRIEYSLCKDKLKQQNLMHTYSGSYGSINLAASLGKTSVQSLLYPHETKEMCTQTEKIITPSPIPPENKTDNPEIFATPLTPDSNNNSIEHAAMGMFAPMGHKVAKTIATIQPLSLNFSHLVDQDLNSSNGNTTMSFLRHRSNSLASRKKSTPLTADISKGSSAASGGVPSSSDSAIDIETAESPKTQRQSRREEFIYYEQCSQRCAVVETQNAARNQTDTKKKKSSANNTTNSDIAVGGTRKNRRKRYNFRSKMMQFFGVCTKCDENNISLDTVESYHSQFPLLEKST